MVEEQYDENYYLVPKDENQAQHYAETVSKNVAFTAEVVQYTGIVAKSITNRMMEAKERIADMRHEIALMEQQGKAAQEAYKFVKPTIESTNEQIQTLLNMMKTFDLNNMNDRAIQAYQAQMVMIATMRQEIMDLYEKVLG